MEVAYGGGANVNYTTGPTTASVSATFDHSPFYNSLLDSMYSPIYGGTDYGSVVNPNDRLSGSASLSRKLGRDTSLGVGYTVSGTSFERNDQDSLTQTGTLSANHQLSRAFALTGAYAYSESDYSNSGTSNPARTHSVDGGFSYSRTRPRGRSFTCAVSAGVSFLDYQEREDRGWRASVSLAQALSRAWSIGGAYTRSLRYDTAVWEPVWSDNASASLNGRFGERTTLTMGAGYNRGNQVTGGTAGYETYYGSAALQVAITRMLAATAQYLYYWYDYPPGYNLPAGMPRRLDRQRILVGASLWLPLARSGRAAEAPAATQ